MTTGHRGRYFIPQQCNKQRNTRRIERQTTRHNKIGHRITDCILFMWSNVNHLQINIVGSYAAPLNRIPSHSIVRRSVLFGVSKKRKSLGYLLCIRFANGQLLTGRLDPFFEFLCACRLHIYICIHDGLLPSITFHRANTCSQCQYLLLFCLLASYWCN